MVSICTEFIIKLDDEGFPRAQRLAGARGARATRGGPRHKGSRRDFSRFDPPPHGESRPHFSKSGPPVERVCPYAYLAVSGYGTFNINEKVISADRGRGGTRSRSYRV